MFITFTAFVLILFLAPPIRLFTGWVPKVTPDKRPTIMAGALAVVFGVILVNGSLADYFGLITVGPGVYLSVAAVLPLWTAILLLNWRFRWFERFLGLASAPRDRQSPSP